MGRATIWLVAALAGCAGAEATTLPASPKAGSAEVETQANDPGIAPGETMAFEVRLGGVLAGEAQMAAGEIGEFEGKKAIVVKSRANTAGAAALIKRIVDEATTVIDVESGRPLQLDTLVEQGSKKTVAHATFNGPIAEVTYQRSDEKPQTIKINFGTQTVHDTHTAMAQIRGWRAAPGTTRSVFVIGGRRLWRVDVKALGTETIGSESMGNRRAIKFEGASYRAKPNFTVELNKPIRTFTVWLSDDADRVPLKVVAHTELGDVTVDLIEYTHP